MATQVVQERISIAMPEDRAGTWVRVKDFFASAVDTLGMYFTFMAPIEGLTPEFREKLNVIEKAQIDAPLHGL